MNKASQRVLEKNGFKQIGVGEEEFEMNGEKVRFVYYLWSRGKSFEIGTKLL